MRELPSGIVLSFVVLVVIGCGTSDSGGSGGSSGSTGTGGLGVIGGSAGVIVGSTGGTSPNGGTGNVGTGGVHPGSGGVSPGTGGTITSTGGTTPGAGGSPACTNTQTDPKNCGTCGHVCKGTCTGGKCDPAMGPCFSQADGFTNCSDDCASIGETCVAASCNADGETMMLFSDATCGGGFVSLSGTCGTPIVWGGQPGRRCCCQ